MQVEIRRIDTLTPYVRNARTHNDAQIDQIAASIKEFGWTNPILVDGDNGIIAGHGRVLAARKLELIEVPCIELAGLTEAQKRAYIIADNKLALNAGWDEQLLGVELSELAAAGYDIALTGFDMAAAEKLEKKAKLTDRKPLTITKTATLDELAPSDEERKAFEGRKILVEYSGGKDSSATAVWARHYFPGAEIELCFADMGADFPGFNLFLHDFASALGCKLNILRSKKNVIETFLEKCEWPGHFHPYCHDILHQALDDSAKSYDPQKVIVIRGGRLKEKARGSKENTTRFLVIDRLKEYTYFQPLYFTDKNVGEGLLEQSGMPIWEGYSYGLQRTACRICPGQKPRAYAAIRANYPEVWAELLELERRFGPGLWSDPENNASARLTESADRGQKDFEAGDYRRR